MIKHFNDYKSVIGYTFGRLKSNSLLNTSYKIYRYARSYLLISRIIRMALAVLTFIETSATLIIISLLLLVLIPISVVAYGLFHFIGLTKAKRKGPLPENFIREGDKLMIIMCERHYLSKKCSFLRNMSLDFKNKGYRVFIINRYLFIGGISSVCRHTDGVYEIKISYFYRLMKFLKKNKISVDVTYIS